MENELKPRQLTKDLIMNMRKANNSETQFFGHLQVLHIKDDNSYLTLSDGYSFTEVALLKSIRPKITQVQLKVFDIVSVTLYLHKGTVDVLISFDLIYSGDLKRIGEPVPYASYIENDCVNPSGESEIPRYLWDDKKSRPTELSTSITAGAQRSTSTGAIIVSDDETHKIASLTTGSTEFNIKVKIMSKSEKRTYTQGKGTNTLFNIVMGDDSDQIQGTFFGVTCEEYYPKIEVGKAYLISSGEVRKASRFNKCRNPNEIYFSSKTKITECVNDIQVNEKFQFKKIGDIQKEPVNTTADVVAVVSSLGEVKDIKIKTGDFKSLRVMRVRDDSNYETEVKLWGEYPEIEQMKEGDVVIFSNVLVSEFNHQKSLNSKQNGTKIILNPSNDIPRVAEVNRWKEGGQEGIKNLNPERKFHETVVMTISQLKRETEYLDKSEPNKQIYTISGYVTNFGKSFTYMKCPNSSCFKKATSEDLGNGTINSQCSVHGRIQQPPVPRFIGNIRVTDHTESIYLNYTSDPVGQLIFGVGPQEMATLADDKDALDTHLKTRNGLKFTFKVTTKFDSYQGESTLKFNVLNCYDQIGKRLLIENKTLIHTLKKLQDNLI